MMLTASEVKEDDIINSKIFHFGTLSMTHANARAATLKALEIAKAANILISFDPNLRPSLWSSLEDAREQVLCGLAYCDILKISDNEIEWLTGEQDFDRGVKWITNRFNIPLILLSMGERGSRAYYKDLRVEMPAFIQSEEKSAGGDKVGAGDTFCGCALHFVLKYGIDDLSKEQLEELLRFSNAAASIITTRKGALMVMPEPEEIEALMCGEL